MLERQRKGVNEQRCRGHSILSMPFNRSSLLGMCSLDEHRYEGPIKGPIRLSNATHDSSKENALFCIFLPLFRDYRRKRQMSHGWEMAHCNEWRLPTSLAIISSYSERRTRKDSLGWDGEKEPRDEEMNGQHQ